MYAVMTLQQFQTWCAVVVSLIAISGWIGIGLGLSLERVAEKHGWGMVRRLVPGFAVAVILACLAYSETVTHVFRTAIMECPDRWGILCWFL